MPAQAKHLYPEKAYKNYWCSAHHGIQEYTLPDKTRVDCLLPNYAVEFDFTDKIYEAIGQSLYYGIMTDRKPAIVLIIENPEKDQKYLARLKKVADKKRITVWITTPAGAGLKNP